MSQGILTEGEGSVRTVDLLGIVVQFRRLYYGILKGKYHCTIDLLFDWFGLVCFANKTKIVCSHTADSKPVKQEVNCTMILPPFVFPAYTNKEVNHAEPSSSVTLP